MTVDLHPICHRAIHAHADHPTLARLGEDRDALLALDGLATFVDWVETKPPDFHAPTYRKARR